jgi:hypothetical protein
LSPSFSQPVFLLWLFWFLSLLSFSLKPSLLQSLSFLLVLSFSLLSQEQGGKLFQMLQMAFDGQSPHVLLSGYDRGFAYVSGIHQDHPLPPLHQIDNPQPLGPAFYHLHAIGKRLQRQHLGHAHAHPIVTAQWVA